MTVNKLLILGGSAEGMALARALAGDARYDAMLSLAGCTEHPAPSPIPVRRGGFGGAEGLARALADSGVDVLIDATHPFAAEMKQNAVRAAKRAGVKLLAIRRPAWEPREGDRWISVTTMKEAAGVLGKTPKRVLLTTGRKELAPFARAPQHFYVLRSVEAPLREALPPRVEVITARGPFALADELRLLRNKSIDILVTKNSGGTATAAKLEAARTLSLPVVMVRRPKVSDAPASVSTVAEALDWLERGHRVTSSA
jgi:precorrin-6A/cobalt-precorrin-6A reductase